MVYVSYGAAVNMMLIAQAQGLASQMFAGWRENLVAWTNSRARTRGSDWNRIEATPSPTKLLAHVMVHEITHILEGVDWHSQRAL
jgi:hypothetical protein